MENKKMGITDSEDVINKAFPKNVKVAAFIAGKTESYQPVELKKFDLHEAKFADYSDIEGETPEIRRIDLRRGLHFNVEDFEHLDLPDGGKEFLMRFAKMDLAHVLNIVHPEAPFTPIMDPSELRIITRATIYELLSARIGNIDGSMVAGVNGLVYEETDGLKLYDGLYDLEMFTNDDGDVMVDRGMVADVASVGGIKQAVLKKCGPIAPMAVGVQAVKYNKTPNKISGLNPRALIGTIEGDNLSPELINQISLRAGIKGPYGLVCVTDGIHVCNGPLSLPETKISSPRDLAGRSEDLTTEGPQKGFGVGSAFDGRGLNLHLHTGAGHLKKLNGSISFIITPASEEGTYNYSDSIQL